jgi:hypothetical protein
MGQAAQGVAVQVDEVWLGEEKSIAEGGKFVFGIKLPGKGRARFKGK